MGLDEDLDFVLLILGSRFEIKTRGRLGRLSMDVQTIDMLGRTIKITKEGDSRHQDILVKHFGMNVSTKVLNKNGYGDVQWQGGSPEEEVELTVSEAKTYRMLAARLNYFGPRHGQAERDRLWQSKKACTLPEGCGSSEIQS